MGLFACGDLQTAIFATATELELATGHALRDPESLRELCKHPSVGNLVELALDPTYAACRWRRSAAPALISGGEAPFHGGPSRPSS
ncbi:MAG: hypothetical protein FJ096_05710 [Deltaproteobacteria bacterium]|nr:hypothetical protein [Deltaproteobacteria bacterium]